MYEKDFILWNLYFIFTKKNKIKIRKKLKIKITHADGEKCERCWKYDKLGTDSEHPTLCPRCTAVLK